MFYYLTEKIRIKTDTYNYIPEVLRNNKITDEEGNVVEEKLVWSKYGYYSTMSGAIKQILKIYPTVVGQDNDKEYMSIKKCLIILNTLKNDIKVKVLNEADIKEDFEEEKEDVKPKTKRTHKGTK